MFKEIFSNKKHSSSYEEFHNRKKSREGTVFPIFMLIFALLCVLYAPIRFVIQITEKFPVG